MANKCYAEDVHPDALKDVEELANAGHNRSLGEFFRLLKAVLEDCVPDDEDPHTINGREFITRRGSYVIGVMIVDTTTSPKHVLRVLALDLTFNNAMTKATARV